MGAQSDSTTYERAIDAHYGCADLTAKLLNSLQVTGKDIDSMTLEDLQSFDQNHIGGNASTRTLAQLAGIQEGDHVLDIGY